MNKVFWLRVAFWVIAVCPIGGLFAFSWWALIVHPEAFERFDVQAIKATLAVFTFVGVAAASFFVCMAIDDAVKEFVKKELGKETQARNKWQELEQEGAKRNGNKQ